VGSIRQYKLSGADVEFGDCSIDSRYLSANASFAAANVQLTANVLLIANALLTANVQ
jgi:hypothetical protein